MSRDARSFRPVAPDVLMAPAADIHRNTLSRLARPKWWIAAPLIWAVPATIAALQSLASAAMYSPVGVGRRDWIVAATQFTHYMLWVPLTPLIFAAVRRFPFQRPGLARAIAIHACIAILCIAFVEVTSTQFQSQLMSATTNRPRVTSVRVVLSQPLRSRLSIGLVTYAAVVAIASALEYQRRLRDDAVRVAQLQRDLSDAQVQAIKMQVQPHFLFNTLHAVNVLIEKDPTAATRMVTRLGDLLRHTLSRPAVAEVPLRTELEVLQLYLEIERTRFRDRLTVHIDAPTGTLEALVPDLILQPLAENAIRHGIGSETGAGSVEVKVSHVDGSLVIEVRDSGRGPRDDVTDRIGLTTVRGRLARLYADDYEFSLVAGPTGGGIARIRIPFRTASG
jgi:two-component system, LytTR family, sensor kinase